MARASALGRSLRAALAARAAQRHSAFDQCLAASSCDAQPQDGRQGEQQSWEEDCRWRLAGSPLGGRKDLYDVLGVAKTAPSSEIKKAYYALAKKYHPDTNKAPGAEKKFQEIQQAWEVLKDDEKRAMYDQVGPDAFETAGAGTGAGAGAGTQGPSGGFAGGFPGGASRFTYSTFGDASPFGNVFEELFGEFGGASPRGRAAGRRRGGVPRPRVAVDLQLSFREAALGCTKTLAFNVPTPCKDCDGSGAEKGTKPETCQACFGTGVWTNKQGIVLKQEPCRACGGAGEIIKSPCGSCAGTGLVNMPVRETVKVPPGVDTGVEMQVSLPHLAAAKGQRSPELLLRVEVLPDPVFVREGQDVHVDVPVSYSQAVLGGSVYVPTLTGQIKLKVHPGTPSGHVSIVRGKGIPPLQRGQAPGDQHVHLHVAVPRTLTSRQRRLLQELAEEEERIASGEAYGSSAASG